MAGALQAVQAVCKGTVDCCCWVMINVRHTRETAPWLRSEKENGDRIRPIALMFALKCSKLMIYTLHTHPELLWKLAKLYG